MAHSEEPSCDCPRMKREAVLGILVPFVAVVIIATLVLLTNQ